MHKLRRARNLSLFIETGAAEAVAGLGYGAGSFTAGVCAAGGRGWNQPTSTGASDFISEITQWSLDNFGEDVIAVEEVVLFIDLIQMLCNQKEHLKYLVLQIQHQQL